MSDPVLSEDVAWLELDDPSDAGAARRLAGEVGRRLGFPESRAAELDLAATEAATNLLRHGGGGWIDVRRVRATAGAGALQGVQLVAADRGPGMSDAALAARDGQSTAGTLGLGLGAIKRLSDRFETWSAPGRGTVSAATFWPRRPPPLSEAAWDVEGMTRPMTGQQICGDAWAWREADGVRQLLLADGLGHGALAAIASTEAVRAFLEAPPARPGDILERVHRALRHTRGAAVAVAELRPGEATVVVAGLGNIGAWVESAGTRRGLLSRPGIAGHQDPQIREHAYELPEGALVVLHSDGLSDRWDLSTYPGLRERSALLVAAVLMRDAGIHRDDSCVVAARA